jgi:hypothetical protein
MYVNGERTSFLKYELCYFAYPICLDAYLLETGCTQRNIRHSGNLKSY